MTDFLHIHQTLFDFLWAYQQRVPKAYFTLRASNHQQRLEQGYWFLGNRQSLNISFWTLYDPTRKAYCIRFCVDHKGKAYLRFSATNAEVYKRLSQLAQEIPNMTETKAGILEKTYEGEDYIAALSTFLKAEKPRIEQYIATQHWDAYFTPIEADVFFARAKRIQQYQLRQPSDTLAETMPTYQKNDLMSFDLPNSNLLLFGPPGTGKTYKSVELAAAILGNTDCTSIEQVLAQSADMHEAAAHVFHEQLHRRIHFITFHQNYNYEDFIGGLRPSTSSDNLQFAWKPGIFLRACTAAFLLAQHGAIPEEEISEEAVMHYLDYCAQHKYALRELPDFRTAAKVVLVIDEINRANLAQVFGELITLIEQDKRLHETHEMLVTLPNGKKFGVPANLILLGTMNTTDHTAGSIDLALRRRFHFIPLYTQYHLLHEDEAQLLRKINQYLSTHRGAEYQIGHSMWLPYRPEAYVTLCNQQLIPLLYAYFMQDAGEVQRVLQQVQNELYRLNLQMHFDENTQYWSVIEIE